MSERGSASKLGALRTAPTRIWREDFQMQAALMALGRWDRLSADEQRRFRELAARGGDDPAARLRAAEHKELRRLWKRMEVRSLLREVLRMVLR